MLVSILFFCVFVPLKLSCGWFFKFVPYNSLVWQIKKMKQLCLCLRQGEIIFQVQALPEIWQWKCQASKVQLVQLLYFPSLWVYIDLCPTWKSFNHDLYILSGDNYIRVVYHFGKYGFIWIFLLAIPGPFPFPGDCNNKYITFLLMASHVMD